MQFSKDLLLVKEKEGVLHIPIIRSGDLSYESSVRCYTQSHSAQVMEDFEERRNADSSRITFLKGEKVHELKVAQRWNPLLVTLICPWSKLDMAWFLELFTSW